jgi:SCY1-like protein 1
MPKMSSQLSGMKLGGGPNKPAATNYGADWDDDEADGTNAWGNDDLIDVNADEDDWAAFESAPVPEIVVPPPQSYYVKPAAAPQSNGLTQSPPPKPPVSTPVPAPVPRVAAAATVVDDWGDVDSQGSGTSSPASKTVAAAVAPSLTAMSKEEKDKEMARRREERKARIAAMKTQKSKE